MKEYPSNMIGKSNLDYLDLEMRKMKKADGWLPSGIETYDMIQCGYPQADHGEMILRCDGGTNKKGELLPPSGMWCKVEDVIQLLNKISEKIENL